MSQKIPITLEGANLGERHRHLNLLVTKAYNALEPFESIVTLKESSTVDRLFKIDFAIKLKHVEYILKCLQNDDMLYVSRALKSKWLLDKEYRHIINPAYLEDFLYPQMITTAANKMKNWINLNMRDPVRSQEFYEYYLEKDGDYAFKFLSQCSEEVILNELPKMEILKSITSKHFKKLCERSPFVAKIYFAMITKDKSLLEKCVANIFKYFEGFKCVLKADADIFLDLIERHYPPHFQRLSAIATKYIIAYHKNRFMQKPELYTTRILKVDTLAQCLTQDEREDLVIRLAQAQYLTTKEEWFSYKNIEPLLKRMDVEKKANLKKKVFVDKDIGELVKDWPYALPESPFELYKDNPVDIFLDEEDSSTEYINSLSYMMHKYYDVKEAKMTTVPPNCNEYHCVGSHLYSTQTTSETLLDSLFEEHRFTTFEKTLFDLRKKIKSESSPQIRMYMMLVLVSKSGGKENRLDALLQLLMERRNELCHVRAAVVRSLVKRAYVWRISDDLWEKFVIFGRGLGLDGDTSEVDCIEGLHAVVVRNLLLNRVFEPAIKIAYFNNFSTLKTYLLTTAEKQHIKKVLLKILLEAANVETNANTVAKILNYALDTLQAYHINFKTHPEIVTCVKHLKQKDQEAAKDILKRLFKSKLGRKELIKENFDLMQTDASYLNALKHDVAILSAEKFVNAVVSDKLNAELFIQKMSIYFNQKNDLASDFITALKEAKIHKRLARPLAYLIGDNLKSYILELDTKDVAVKRYSAVIRSHAHVARPAFSIDSLGWHQGGVKFIANKVLKCRAIDVDHLINKLLTSKRTARLAIVLSQRTNYEGKVFAAVANIRPTIALKTALIYFRRKGDNSNIIVWQIVKPLIVKVKDSTIANRHQLRRFNKIEWIPLSIRTEYATEIFKVIKKVDFFESMNVSCHIIILLPNIEDDFIEEILSDFFNNQLVSGAEQGNNLSSEKAITFFLKIFSKYLLLCKTEDIQSRRFKIVGQWCFDFLELYWKDKEKKTKFFKYLNEIIKSFKYHKAFLNEDYVSCLPVMEKFENWMQTFLPMEKYINYYIPLHLNKLYYKAVRQTIEQMPEIFTDVDRRRNEGYKIVGENFGKCIANEAKELIKQYFDSIVLLYNTGLVKYVRSFGLGSYSMLSYIIKGIIDVSDGIECTLALSLYDNNVPYLDNVNTEEILKYIRGNDQIEKFQLYFYDSDSD